MPTLVEAGYHIRYPYRHFISWECDQSSDVLRPAVRPVGRIKMRGLAWSVFPGWCQYAFWWRWLIAGGADSTPLRLRLMARRNMPEPTAPPPNIEE